jgi:aspartokinase-like uncharacterized kinase
VRPDDAIVVKLGGSLSESGRISELLDIVDGAGRPCIVVPGGGAFADTVRAAQKAHGFDDGAAHRMALLAMEQSGLMLAALCPRLVPAESAAAIRAALELDATPVWMPAAMMAHDTAVVADWTTTSDSLAARLAELLGGLPLALVKSCAVPRDASAEVLAHAGIVDAAFAAIVARAGLEWRAFGPGDIQELIDLLASPGASGRRTGPARAIAPRR